MIAESYEKSFSKNYTIIYFSRLLVKKLFIECISADRESWLAIIMAHNLVGRKGVSNKRGIAPTPLKQFLKGRLNLFLPLPTNYSDILKK